MKDHTIQGIRRPSTLESVGRREESRYLCNMDHCERETSELVGIALCDRHLQKAWAAYQILNGVQAPPAEADPERDVTSLDARGTVYVIRVGELIKIGWTSNPNKRWNELQADAVLHSTPGTRRDEYRMHGQCIDHLAKGREWFHANAAMTRYIKNLQAGKVAA